MPDPEPRNQAPTSDPGASASEAAQPERSASRRPSGDQHPGVFTRLMGRLRTLRPQPDLERIFDEQCNRLRHAVLNHPTVRDVKSILITSAIPGEGKTTLACGLARAFATSLDYWTLLVETDLRHQSLARAFGVNPAPGLTEHILAGVPLPQVIQKTDLPKLSVIVAGSRDVAPANVIASSQMKAFSDEIRNRYKDRIVIFDAPPIVPTPEPLSLSLLADGIILVVHADETSRSVVQRALKLMPPSKMLGVVLNGVSLGREDRRYYGEYYYYDRQAVAGGLAGSSA